MELLKDIIEKTMQGYGLRESMISASIINKSNQILTDIMGQASQKHIKAKKLENNVLYLHSKNSVYSQEFHLHKNQFVDLLRQAFPDRKIIDVVVRMDEKQLLY